jgi:hypothetical protein
MRISYEGPIFFAFRLETPLYPKTEMPPESFVK